MTAKCEKCKIPVTAKVEEFCLKANKPMRCYKCQQEEKEGSPKPFQKSLPNTTVNNYAPAGKNNNNDLIIRQTCIKATATLLQGKTVDTIEAEEWLKFFYNWVKQ